VKSEERKEKERREREGIRVPYLFINTLKKGEK